MKKFIVYTIIIAAAAVAAACGGGKRNAGDTAVGGRNAVITLSDSLISHRGADTIDFGRVREGERIVREFMLRNGGDRIMVVKGLDLSCGCVEAQYPKQPLKPGEEKEITLTLDTRNLGGWIFKSAIMHTSLSAKPYVLYITAEIE